MKRLALIAEIILLTMVFALVGCSTTPQERVVVKIETRVVTIPESLLTKPKTPVPPSKQEYLEANAQKKESLLADYIGSLLKTIKDLGNTIDSIADSQKKQLEAIERNKVTP